MSDHRNGSGLAVYTTQNSIMNIKKMKSPVFDVIHVWMQFIKDENTNR